MSDYGQLSTEFYVLDKPDAPPDALDFYADFARAAHGPIHEPMCGSGRFLLPLLAEGLDISGSDSSEAMLLACRARAAALGVGAKLQLSQQLLGELTLPAPPALMFIPSGSFGLLIDDASVDRALKRVFDSLAPGGKLLLEAERVPEAAPAPETSGGWGGRWVERADGAKLVMSWLSQYSGRGNVTTSLLRYELVKGGQLLATEFQDFEVRSYAEGELEPRLRAAGFSLIEAFQPYARTAPTASDDAVVFCATKA